MVQPLQTVIVGCGGISNAWLEPAAAREDLELIGFVDLKVEAAQKQAGIYAPNAVAGTDLAAILQETQADVVFDCTLPEAHVGVTLTALGHGCHVLGEKPMADSMEHALAMAKAADKAGKVYAVIQNRRYLPEIRAVRDFLESEALGAITTVQSNFFIGAHFGGFRDVMKHVLVLDMAIHTFDAARYLTGADALHVYCQEWNPKGSWYQHGASALALFEMEQGIRYIYQGSWCAEGLNTTWEADWHILCEQGSLHWNGGSEIRVEKVAKRDGLISEVEPLIVTIPEMDPSQRGHSGLIDDFVKAVQGGQQPMTHCSDNIKSLAMVHSAIASAEAGERQAIKHT